MKTMTFWLGVLLAVSAGAEGLPSIYVAFPPEGAKVPASRKIHVVGAVNGTNGVLRVNGAKTDIYHTGAFLAMVPVAEGANTLRVSWGTNRLVRTFTVMAETPPPPTPPENVRTPPKTTHDPYVDLALPTNAVFAARPPKDRPWREIFVMVDAGHGGTDTGARSPHGLCEKQVNLQVARAVCEALTAAGFQVMMTRTDDAFPPLYQRPKDAWLTRADAFISIHHNATAASANPRQVRHTVAYAANEKGYALAAALQNRIAPVVAPVRNLGAQMKSLAVCRNPAVPSCLLEIDFVNLPEGEEDSWNPARQKRVAAAVAEGFKDWLRSAEAPHAAH